MLLCQQANKQAQSQHKEQTAKLEVAPEPVWGVSAAVWAALLWFQPWLNEWNLATFKLKCCILIFPLPCSHKTKRSRLGTTQSIIPGKENLWETYTVASKVMPISACSVTLWMHAEYAMKPLKCLSVSYQWIWRNSNLIKWCHSSSNNNNWFMVNMCLLSYGCT